MKNRWRKLKRRFLSGKHHSNRIREGWRKLGTIPKLAKNRKVSWVLRGSCFWKSERKSWSWQLQTNGNRLRPTSIRTWFRIIFTNATGCQIPGCMVGDLPRRETSTTAQASLRSCSMILKIRIDGSSWVKLMLRLYDGPSPTWMSMPRSSISFTVPYHLGFTWWTLRHSARSMSDWYSKWMMNSLVTEEVRLWCPSSSLETQERYSEDRKAVRFLSTIWCRTRCLLLSTMPMMTKSIRYAGLIVRILICYLQARTTVLSKFGIEEHLEAVKGQLEYLLAIKKVSRMLQAKVMVFTLLQMVKTSSSRYGISEKQKIPSLSETTWNP